MSPPPRSSPSSPAAAESAAPTVASTPRPAPPGVTRDEVDLLLRRAGLTLDAGQKADLAVSFQHLVTLAAMLPRERPLSDEPAFVFHPGAADPLPPPAAPARRPEAAKPARTAARGAAKPAPKPSAKPAAKAKPAPKAAAKPTTKAKPKLTARSAAKSARAALKRAKRR